MTNAIKLKILNSLITFWPFRPQIKTFDSLIEPWLLALQTGQWTPFCEQNRNILVIICGRLNYLKNYKKYRVVERYCE
jgi:hypothetical protein